MAAVSGSAHRKQSEIKCYTRIHSSGSITGYLNQMVAPKCPAHRKSFLRNSAQSQGLIRLTRSDSRQDVHKMEAWMKGPFRSGPGKGKEIMRESAPRLGA